MTCLTSSTLPEAYEVLSKRKVDFVLIDGSFPKEVEILTYHAKLIGRIAATYACFSGCYGLFCRIRELETIS